MKSNKGEVIERIVRSKIGISELSRILGVSRTTIYNWFEQGHLDLDTICRIGQAINHDFANEFPEEFANTHLHHTAGLKPEKPDENCSIQYWMDKYISLLEKFNESLNSFTKAELNAHSENVNTNSVIIQHNPDAKYFLEKEDSNLTY
jgi:transcriptional regulator with XRE-family HTH domain